MSHRFVNFNLPELQTYLRKRGITVSGYNKPALIDIAVAADKLQLSTDPDLSSDSTTDVIKNKLQQANLSTYITSDPLKINGYTEAFSSIPEFGLIDIFNYLIFSKSEYDGKKLKGYKSFEKLIIFGWSCY
ncbi:hypothetical protein SNE40_018233 [Patella caerulea]|uniref:Uncharacterized protein n=1 Tax=Patella caerulea TaxID=87958 RepID=A0AAN8PGU6_PATCE